MNCHIESYTLHGGRTRRKLVFEEPELTLFTEFFAVETKRSLRALEAQLKDGAESAEFAGNLFRAVIAEGTVKLSTDVDNAPEREAEMSLADFRECLAMLLD